MPQFLRLILGTVLLIATIGLITCQSLLNAQPVDTVAVIKSSVKLP